MSDPSDTKDKRKRRLAWIVGVIAVPPLLAAATSVVNRKSIEDDLTSRTETALADAGYDAATVEYRGRDATVTITDANADFDEEKIKDVVRDVEGNRVVDVEGPRQSGDTDTTPAAFSVATEGGDVVVGRPRTAQPAGEADDDRRCGQTGR